MIRNLIGQYKIKTRNAIMKRYYLFILSFLIVCLINPWSYSLPIEPTRFDTNLEIGTLSCSDKHLKNNQDSFCIYEVSQTQLIPLATIVEMNIPITEIDDIIYIGHDKIIDNNSEILGLKPYTGRCNKVYLCNKEIVIGNSHTYSVKVDDSLMIPLESLKALYDIEKLGAMYTLCPKVYKERTLLEIKGKTIYNTSEYTVYFDYIDRYWDGENIIHIFSKNQILSSFDEQEMTFKSEIDNKPVIYINSYIENIQDLPLPTPKELGQMPINLYRNYTKVKRIKELEQVFIKLKVKAKINYDVAGFKTGEQVELWRSEKNQYHVILREDGKKVNVPYGSLTVIGGNGQGWKEATQKEIEDYVNLKDYESETNHLLWTDLFRQRTYVLEGSKNNWQLIKIMKCSTGKDKSLTPSGVFKIEYKIPYFGLEKGYRCKNASVIFRDYMYHSVLFDKTGEYVKSGLYQLGSRVSHGCIRLSEEDSEWIYKNILEKTKVYVE